MPNHTHHPMQFKDKVVIVTGGSRGIGKEIAKAFAKEGAFVNILARNSPLAEEVSREILKEGGKAQSFGCDVSNLKMTDEILNKILDKCKSIDILVNNAGITKDNLLLRMSEEDWDDVLKVNLKGVFNTTKSAVKVMLKKKQGRIINIASIIGITGNIGQANYAASKAGIIGFTKSIAKEIAFRGITVNAIAPGYIETDMTSQLNEKVKGELLKQIPLGRLGTAQDVAGVCLFLASEEASYITGQTITIDGGLAI